MKNFIRNAPLTILLSLIAVIVSFVPSLTSLLQLDFSAVGEGQWWRIWTGHLTHYDGDHLFWDLLMFATLGIACEWKRGWKFLLAIVLMMPLISFTIAICCSVPIYRGLSGVDTGLFVWFVIDQARQNLQRKDPATAVIWLLPLTGLLGKLVFEAATGQTLFVDSTNFRPLVESHLAGALGGLLFAIDIRSDRFNAFRLRWNRSTVETEPNPRCCRR